MFQHQRGEIKPILLISLIRHALGRGVLDQVRVLEAPAELQSISLLLSFFIKMSGRTSSVICAEYLASICFTV